jgi:hypothetical protein
LLVLSQCVCTYFCCAERLACGSVSLDAVICGFNPAETQTYVALPLPSLLPCCCSPSDHAHDVVAGLLRAGWCSLEFFQAVNHVHMGFNLTKYDAQLSCHCCVIDLDCVLASQFPMCLCWFVSGWSTLARAAAYDCTPGHVLLQQQIRRSQVVPLLCCWHSFMLLVCVFLVY